MFSSNFVPIMHYFGDDEVFFANRKWRHGFVSSRGRCALTSEMYSLKGWFRGYNHALYRHLLLIFNRLRVPGFPHFRQSVWGFHGNQHEESQNSEEHFHTSNCNFWAWESVNEFGLYACIVRKESKNIKGASDLHVYFITLWGAPPLIRSQQIV